jgi:hypothetical protein
MMKSQTQSKQVTQSQTCRGRGSSKKQCNEG